MTPTIKRCKAFVGARQIAGSWHQAHTCRNRATRGDYCGTHANQREREAAYWARIGGGPAAPAVGDSYLDEILDATVNVVAPARGSVCQDCEKLPVTREVYGGTYGDGSDNWEAFLCGPCLLHRVNEQRRQDEKLAKLMDERDAAEAEEVQA